MPEGPEVKRITQQLSKNVKRRLLKEIQVLSGRYQTHGPPDGLNEFGGLLPIQIHDVFCTGKFIYWVTDIEPLWSIWNTLGLTGSWSVEEQEHSRLIFHFENSHPVYFNDMRNFGTLKFVKGGQLLVDKLNTLGPDMLVASLSDDDFADRFKKHGFKTLPEVLMNQSIISGVGNYIKAESLYMSGLSPYRLWNSLSKEEISKLHNSIKTVMSNSFNLGGATIKTYADMDGNIGSYSSKFLIYNQKKDPKGNEVIREETKDKRVTHWVPAVQK